MDFTFSDEDLARIAGAVTLELQAQQADGAKLNGRLAFREAEAAALLGLPQHSLRDARLRGEVNASRVGTRLLYAKADLLELLRKKREA